MKFILSLSITLCVRVMLQAQITDQDTLKKQNLKQVEVIYYKQEQPIKYLPDVHQTFIVGGRKNEVIAVQGMAANIAEKTGRQIFAKIPGAFVYDMDGAGNQVNIATRGLDPHRSWEFNIRQNGVVMNSDLYGYPASHYSPPMEAIKNIEMVRGTAALQYGAEFGGMVNYVVKAPDTSRVLAFESINNVGSYGLFSSYNAAGGTIGKFSYYAYYYNRHSDGYRKNSTSDAEAQYAFVKYAFNDRLSLSGSVGRSQYLYCIPGPLTDSMFRADPRQSTRNRNYYSPDILIPSLTLDWKISDRTQLSWIVSGVYGARKSIEFEGFADRVDALDPITLQYKNRAVNIDQFNSNTSELRLLHRYAIKGKANVVSVGIRYFNNDLHRRQQGKGSTGTDYDLSITGDWGRNLHYKSHSAAIAVENMFYLTHRFSITPGMRYELGATDMLGYISYLGDEDVPNRIEHNIPAFGCNFQYRFDEANRIYGGVSQAHRPVLFKDIIPTSALERSDKNLKNALGYNAEIGVNGLLFDQLKYDLTFFRIQYNNRLGNFVRNENGADYIFKTNIGNSQTNGIEFYSEWMPVRTPKSQISLFSSTSLMKAVYQNAVIAVGTENRDISGNELESVPRWISRNGLSGAYKGFFASVQYSYTAQSYSDPLNTEAPTANGARGIVPAYGIWDLNLLYRFNQRIQLKASLNNLTNLQYFTKRPLFYPGPGVWSSDGRTIVCSVALNL